MLKVFLFDNGGKLVLYSEVLMENFGFFPSFLFLNLGKRDFLQ
jgi:hypothetical protein